MVKTHPHYKKLSILGRGGFGTVYHARYHGNGDFSQDVALKVLNPEMEDVADISSRLRDEARILGKVQHHAIVKVYQLVQLNGCWTVVMEYVEGSDLGTVVKQGPLPLSVALDILAEIAGALDAAYQQIGALHRDLKPSNIRLTRYGGVKVLDFGIARAEFAAREAQTRSMAFGTLEFMSPERLDFAEATLASDVYSLGALGYEMLTGERLGKGSANQDKHHRFVEDASDDLYFAEVPVEVIDLLVRMLAFDAHRRPEPRAVEQQATELSRSFGGVSLRSWARENIHSTTTALTDNDTVSTILSEYIDHAALEPQDHSETHPISPSAGYEKTGLLIRLLPWFAVPPLGVFTILILCAALVVRLTLDSGPAPQVTASLPSSTDLPEPEPSIEQILQYEESDVSETEIQEPSPAPTQQASPPPPERREEAIEPQPPKEQQGKPIAPVRVKVRVQGDAQSVYLVSSRGRRYPVPGKVPPGLYNIHAVFETVGDFTSSRFRINAGAPFTIQCSSNFGNCRSGRSP